MEFLWSLFTLAGVHLIAVASPGPAFLSVVQTSVRNPRRITFLHVLGLGSAVALWAAATLFGLSAILTAVGGLYRFLQLAGGLYFVWIGVQSFRHAADPLPPSTEVAAHIPPLRAFKRGFSTNIANPKVMVFFASIFTAILKPGTPLWVRFTAIAIVFANETLWNGSLGLLLSTPRAQRTYARAKSSIDRTVGTVMFLFGLKLLWGAAYPSTH
ncbi:LysE family transporter [Granulicella sp. dw_53]|uniref:LysE family translocator n=1 Tax=Granulicella sp. dw_53 TaxID=2719792 RepID=UPI001BD338E6|nr:LysE family transporter [Granulicella sp. dw_53]